MKKVFLLLGGVLAIAGIAWAGLFYWQNLRRIGPALKPPPEDIVDLLEGGGEQEDDVLPPGQNDTDFPLRLPDGFSISVFAKDLPGARVMAQDAFGNMYVSDDKAGVIYRVTYDPSTSSNITIP